MGRSGITLEEVQVACNDLLDETGKKPTRQEVRERLGTGSFNTICKFYKEWEANLGEDFEEDEPIPPELQKKFMEMVGVMWRQATKDFETQLMAIKKEFANSQKIAEEEFNQSSKIIDKQEEKISALGKTISELKEKEKVQDKALAEANRTIGRLEAIETESKRTIDRLEKSLAEASQTKRKSRTTTTRAKKPATNKKMELVSS